MGRREPKTTTLGSARRAANVPKTPAERPLAVTTVRLYRDQLQRLHEMALARRFEGGHTGRADASAALREILDAAFGVR